MTEPCPTYGATPPDDGIARCPDCGVYPAGHSAETCVQVLKWQLRYAKQCVADLMALAVVQRALEELELEGERE